MLRCVRQLQGQGAVSGVFLAEVRRGKHRRRLDPQAVVEERRPLHERGATGSPHHHLAERDAVFLCHAYLGGDPEAMHMDVDAPVGDTERRRSRTERLRAVVGGVSEATSRGHRGGHVPGAAPFLLPQHGVVFLCLEVDEQRHIQWFMSVREDQLIRRKLLVCVVDRVPRERHNVLRVVAPHRVCRHAEHSLVLLREAASRLGHSDGHHRRRHKQYQDHGSHARSVKSHLVGSRPRIQIAPHCSQHQHKHSKLTVLYNRYNCPHVPRQRHRATIVRRRLASAFKHTFIYGLNSVPDTPG